jgi:hypothetical protein
MLPDMTAKRPVERGPFRVDQLRPGDPYELLHGHLVYCAPTGGRGSGPNLTGGSVVAWDPAVSEAGVDTGYALMADLMRAPDVAVGNVPDRPGWVPGVPSLAIEFADVGQDEETLAIKIEDLLDAGTRWIWVVRLVDPRHVEVHAPGEPVARVWPGELLHAPGVLKNPVPVEALYDRTAAQRATLINLLQREGYASLDAVRSEGRKEGLQRTVREICDVLGIALSPEQEAALVAMDEPALNAAIAQLKRERRWPAP